MITWRDCKLQWCYFTFICSAQWNLIEKKVASGQVEGISFMVLLVCLQKDWQLVHSSDSKWQQKIILYRSWIDLLLLIVITSINRVVGVKPMKIFPKIVFVHPKIGLFSSFYGYDILCSLRLVETFWLVEIFVWECLTSIKST